jgi:D-glycero-D-manno-heptose 1,7-bisphosphate phosphatase
VRAAVFLDRDGVLVESLVAPDGVARPPASLDDTVLTPDAKSATSMLRDAGFVLVVVTNQPDVPRNITPLGVVEAINRLVVDQLGLDAVYACLHDGDSCECRKPKPGMLTGAARDLELDLPASWLIGDRWVDIGAAAAAGVRSVLLERDYSWRQAGGVLPPADLHPDFTVAALNDAAALITGTDGPSRA